MQLTRRDAVAALIATGIGAGAITIAEREGGNSGSGGSISAAELAVLVATAKVVYPTEVSATEEFVETYSLGRIRGREEYRDGVKSAIREVETYTKRQAGTRYTDLSVADRDRLLREMGVDRVQPRPDGTVPQRVRYYLVNELLYALYSTPTGGELIGLENPPGHGGGLDSYQRGPDE